MGEKRNAIGTRKKETTWKTRYRWLHNLKRVFGGAGIATGWTTKGSEFDSW
jgi:hypothetical protein